MAPLWPGGLPGGGRRRQVLLIITSAIIPFTFIIVFLLSWSPSAPLQAPHTQPESDHFHAPPAPPPSQPIPSTEPLPLIKPDMPPVPLPPVQEDHTTTDQGGNVVKASTGYYQGKIDDKYDNVREFLNVPYGLSTAGKNRFMPPVPVPRSDQRYDATEYAMACPQFVGALPSIWSEQIPWYRIPHEKSEMGETAALTSEDCLSAAIWTPANATSDSNLPVAMFWPGGGFQTNGILVPAHQAAQWVARSQSHIVVTINYRLGILGFPDAAGLDEQNLGLLDQRLALEWVRDNIHSFGGDPSKILVWGFSAGAQSVDFHNYAHWEDPIARSYFAQSGSCLAFGSGHASDHAKFTLVARKFECDFPDDSARELECMQQLDYKDIVDFIGQYHGDERLRFGPVTDEKTVFSDYKARYAKGQVSKVPMIYSSCSNDGASLAGYNAQNPEDGPSQDSVNAITQRIMCGAAESSKLRHDAGLVSYRYQYAGTWPNQNPLSWLGAYHSSDLPMFFGTFDNGGGPMSLPLEIETSEAMQDLLLSFLRDPDNVAGWPTFDPTAADGGTMLRFGANDKAVQNVPGESVEGVCSGQGTYEPFP